MRKKKIAVKFYRIHPSGNEPAREWLKSLPKEITKVIGEDIMTVQMTWPVGMPLVKNMGNKLWELRSSIPNGIARVFFIMREEEMILLHGFIKKSRQTPAQELKIGRSRMRDFQE